MENTAHIDGNGNIVIQGVDGAIITINPDNSSEVRQLIIDLGSKLTDLPTDILNMIESKQDIQSDIKVGANINLNVLADISSDSQFSRLKFGLTITNLTKENRYFNQPFFKVNPKFDIKTGGQHDTFIMIPENFNSFPKKLEYGEPLFVKYEIKDGAYKMYQDILSKNDDAYIQSFTNTTVGELYESNRFSIKKLFEHLKWLKQ